MTSVESLLADGVPLRRERITVPSDDLARIRANLERGIDCWVAAVVVDGRGRIVFVRNRWSDGWVAPGGSAEPGEPPATAAEREVRKETGIEAIVREPLAVVEEVFEHGDRTARESRPSSGSTRCPGGCSTGNSSNVGAIGTGRRACRRSSKLSGRSHTAEWPTSSGTPDRRRRRGRGR